MTLRKLLFGVPGNFEEFYKDIKNKSYKEFELEIFANVYVAGGSSLDSILYPYGYLIFKAKKENSRPIKLKIKPKIEEKEWVIEGDPVRAYVEFFEVLANKAEIYKQYLKTMGSLSIKENNHIPKKLKYYGIKSRFSYIPNKEIVRKIEQIDDLKK